MMSHCAGSIANNSTGWLDSPRDEVIDRVPVLDVGSVVTMIRFIDDERSAVAKFKCSVISASHAEQAGLFSGHALYRTQRSGLCVETMFQLTPTPSR